MCSRRRHCLRIKFLLNFYGGGGGVGVVTSQGVTKSMKMRQ